MARAGCDNQVGQYGGEYVSPYRAGGLGVRALAGIWSATRKAVWGRTSLGTDTSTTMLAIGNASRWSNMAALGCGTYVRQYGNHVGRPYCLSPMGLLGAICRTLLVTIWRRADEPRARAFRLLGSVPIPPRFRNVSWEAQVGSFPVGGGLHGGRRCCLSWPGFRWWWSGSLRRGGSGGWTARAGCSCWIGRPRWTGTGLVRHCRWRRCGSPAGCRRWRLRWGGWRTSVRAGQRLSTTWICGAPTRPIRSGGPAPSCWRPAVVLAAVSRGDSAALAALMISAWPPLAPAALTGPVTDELPGRVVSFAWPGRGGPPMHLLQPAETPAAPESATALTQPAAPTNVGACARCGDPLPARSAARGGRPAQYCSDRCRVAAHRARTVQSTISIVTFP